MSVVNLTNLQPTVWIPPSFTPEWKIEIVFLDGTVMDVTAIILEGKITDACTDEIGGFSIKLPNGDEAFTGVFEGGETFNYYCDYAADATTLRFSGIVEKPNYNNHELIISGRSHGLYLIDRTVTKTYSSVDAADILRDLISSYGGGRFTVTGIPVVVGIQLTFDWVQKSFIDCVRDICVATGYDWYVSALKDVSLFVLADNINDDDAIVDEFNLVSVGEFADDLSLVRNKVRVYGKNANGVQVLYTASDPQLLDAAYLSRVGIKELIIQDESITTFEAARDLAELRLGENITPPKVGDVKSTQLCTVLPGQYITISAVYDGLSEGRYPVKQIEHEFSVDGIVFSTVVVNKEPRSYKSALKKLTETSNSLQDASPNPEDLDFSYHFTFDDAGGGSLTNAIISNGVLTVEPGYSMGIWISPTRVLDTSLDQVYLNIDAENNAGIIVEVSGNAGVTYEVASVRTLQTISTAAGPNLKVRITMTGASSQVSGVSLLYNTTT
jgi:hypothetical protein